MGRDLHITYYKQQRWGRADQPGTRHGDASSASHPGNLLERPQGQQPQRPQQLKSDLQGHSWSQVGPRPGLHSRSPPTQQPQPRDLSM